MYTTHHISQPGPFAVGRLITGKGKMMKLKMKTNNSLTAK